MSIATFLAVLLVLAVLVIIAHRLFVIAELLFIVARNESYPDALRAMGRDE